MTTIGNVGKLDVMTMVAQLVAAERAQPEARIARSEREVSAQISAIGTLRSAFSALGKALEGLDSGEGLSARKAHVPEDAGFSASARGGVSNPELS